MNTIDTVWVQVQTRLMELIDDERGDGGGSALTNALLVVAGVVGVGLVVGAIGLAIANAVGAIGGK